MAIRDEILRIAYQVAGREEIAAAAESMLQAAKAGGQSAEQIEALAAAFKALAQRAADQQSLREAITAYGELAAKQDDVADAADRAGLRLKFAAEQEQSTAAILRAKAAALDDARAVQADYAQQENRLLLVERELAAAVKEAAAEQKVANEDWKTAAADQREAAFAYDKTASAQEALTKRMDDLGAKIRDAKLSTDDLASAQRELGAHAADTEREMAQLVDGAKASAAAAKAQAAAQQEAARVQADAVRAAESARAAETASIKTRLASIASLDRWKAKTTEAAKGNDELTASTERQSVAVGKLRTLLGAAAALIGFDKLLDGVKSVIKAGDDAEQALGQVDAALKSTGNQAGYTAKDLDAMAEKFRDASNFSKEQIIAAQTRLLSYTDVARREFPRAMQIVIDQSQRLNISIEQSAEIVGKALQSPADAMSALGKQGFKFSESQRALLKDLEATGQTARAQSIIMDMLAESYGGAAAAARVSTLRGLWKGLTDQVGDFFGRVADAGVLDFLKARLAAITQEISDLTAGGSLDAWARRVADAMISAARGVEAVGRGVVSATRWLIDHSAALATVVKGYVVFRAAMFALDLAGAAAKMLGLAEATKVAGAAAEAAGAAKGGFGALLDRINRLPKTIQIGIAIAAVDFALSNLEELISKTNEFWALQARLKEQDAELAAQRETLGAKARAVADQLRSYAGQQIADADALAGKSREQSSAYIEQLQNAVRYYTALRLQQRAGGDDAGVAASTARLRELGEAIAAARTHIETIGPAAKKIADDVALVVDRFDRLRSQGVASATAIRGAFEGLELRTPEGMQKIIGILQQVSIRSRDARDAVQSELLDALSKLNSADLLDFEQRIAQRLSTTKGNVDGLRNALDAVVRAAAFEKLGLSAEQSGQQITESGREIIGAFEAVAASGRSSSKQIQLAFSAALSNAQTSGEVEALRAKLRRLFEDGRISAETFGTASEAAGRKLAEIQTAATVASASLDGMGKAGETASARISAALQDARDKLVVEANRLSAAINAALAAGDKAGAQALTAQFKGVDAQLQELNAKINQVGNALTTTFGGGSTGVQNFAHEMGNAVQAVDGVIDTSTTASRAIAGMSASTDAARGKIADFSYELMGWSEKAVNAFLQAQNAAMQFLREDTGGAGLRLYIDGVNRAVDELNSRIAEQRDAADRWVAYNSALTEQQIEALGRQSGGYDTLIQQLRSATSQFDLLDAQTLSRVQAAADAVAQKVEAIRDRAIAARESLESMADSLRDQIDQMNGDQEASEDRRYKNQLEQLRKQAEAAGVLNSAEYNDAVAAANELHRLKMQQIEAERRARDQANDAGTDAGGGRGTGSEGANRGRGDAGTSGGGQGDGPGRGAPSENSAPGRTQSQTAINVNVQGSVIGGTPAELAERLARMIKPELERIARASR